MSEIYRLATQNDAHRLQSLIYEAYATIRELNLQWPAANADLELVRANIANNECYVLEENGAIVATLTLSKEKMTHWNTELPFVKWFAVDPASQGKGFGKKLLDWVGEAVIRDKLGASAFTLATAEKHPWLLAMYEKWGFERIASIDRGNGDGTMHLLRKKLSPRAVSSRTGEEDARPAFKRPPGNDHWRK